MVVKISRGAVRADEVSSLKAWLSNEWYPLIKKQEGSTGFCAALRESGEFVVITHWRDKAAMESWNDNGAHKDIVKNLLPLLAVEISPEVYEELSF